MSVQGLGLANRSRWQHWPAKAFRRTGKPDVGTDKPPFSPATCTTPLLWITAGQPAVVGAGRHAVLLLLLQHWRDYSARNIP
jgi:hypothetical protein